MQILSVYFVRPSVWKSREFRRYARSYNWEQFKRLLKQLKGGTNDIITQI